MCFRVNIVHMRITLVFPPPASPTYVPLGLASLVSYLRMGVPETKVRVCDLNLTLWSDLAGQTPAGRLLWDFMRGRSGPFYDPTAYAVHQATWGTLADQVGRLAAQAKSYLEAGRCTPQLDLLLDAWAKDICAAAPEVVGFSVMFLDQAPLALALALCIDHLRDKKERVPRLVLGGAAMSALNISELLRAAPFLDAALPGEGEQALALLCQGVPLAEIPGMRTPRFSGVVPATEPIPPALDTVGAPDFSAFHVDRYPNPTAVLPVVLSRDCAWRRCRFCAHNFSFGGYRAKTIPQVVGELELLMSRHGVNHFYFADQYISAATLEQLSDEILRRGLSLHFHLMGRPTQDLTTARLAKAAAAGCHWISWGIETGSQRLLKLVRKGTRRDEIERLMERSYEAGIANLMMMIFGLPTSTEEDLNQTLDLIERVYHLVAAIKTSSFVLFDGTYFAQHPERFGLAITGRQQLLRIEDQPVHTSRLDFMVKAADGSLMPPPGPLEVSRWTQRRRWLGELSFLETLGCEHFLLYSTLQKAGSQDRPVRPLPRKAA
ncbi:MAG: radical SAM protein [Sedimentisphaerales bacterium]|nr:radical SAM protein [Sedimentisphaerales bacterium]